MAGIWMMAAIPTGRKLISHVREVQPKWLMATGAERIGALRRTPLGTRFVSRHEDDHGGHKHHWSYVGVVGVAAGVVTLICFYLCLWLVRHQRRQRTPPAPRQQLSLAPPDHQNAEEEGYRPKTAGPRGDGDSAKQMWSSESVELVVMAGEHVPTFVAHPVVQCPAPLPAQEKLRSLT